MVAIGGPLVRKFPSASAAHNVGDKLLLASHSIIHPVFEKAQNLTYTQDWPAHHALADARVLMAGFRAWKAFMEPINRIR